MSKLNWFDLLTLVFVVVGGLNWGLISIDSSWNLVVLLFGETIWASVVYALVGLSALYLIFLIGRLAKRTRV